MRGLGTIYTSRNTEDGCLVEDIGNALKKLLQQREVKDATLDKLAKQYNIYEDHQKSGTGEIHVTIAGKDVDL